MDDRIRQHCIQLRRSAGLTGEGPSTTLNRIYTYDELKGYYVRNVADLDYGLWVEPRRDRIVMNKQEFEKTLEKCATESLNNLQKDIIEWVNTSVMDEIETETLFLLNSITNTNGTFTAKTPSASDKVTSKLGVALGKALAKDMLYVWNDMTGNGKKKKRRK